MSLLRVIFVILLIGCCAGGGICAPVARLSTTSAGAAVMLTDVVLTFVAPAECYVEDQNRSAGIRVVGDTAALQIGDCVNVLGALEQENGQRFINAQSIVLTGAQAVINPFGVTNSAIGGTYLGLDWLSEQVDGQWRRAWLPAVGLGTLGLLTTTWGTVNAVYHSPVTGARWFFIDDGSEAVSDLGDIGVMVYSDADVKQGDFVSVTGVSSAEPALDGPSRNVRVVRALPDGVKVLRTPEPLFPFSDEFDKPMLDWRWGGPHRCLPFGPEAVWSLSLNPGWLTLSLSGGEHTTYAYTHHLIQAMPGDCDVEVRLRLERAPGTSASQGIALVLGRSDCPTVFAAPPDAHTVTWMAVVFADAAYPETRACVANSIVDGATGDTWVFRLSRRGDTLTGSASADGVTFSPASSTNCAGRWILQLYAYSGVAVSPLPPVTGLCDYIRITPVNH